MGDATAKRKQRFFSFRRLLIGIVLLFGISSIWITIVYTIPELTSYMRTNAYISPLGAKFSLDEALGTEITREMVKEKVKKAGFSIKEIIAFDNGYEVILDSGEKILFSKKKSLDNQISSLQLISSRFTIEGKEFKQLDLRFDRPVIVPK